MPIPETKAKIQAIRAVLNSEQTRIELIRKAALRYSVALQAQPDFCWKRAKEFWAAKPEDC